MMSSTWSYDNNKREIVDNFNYLGTVLNYTFSGKGIESTECIYEQYKTISHLQQVSSLPIG